VHQTPMDIAKERYARGEIDRVAFEEIRDTSKTTDAAS